MINVQNITSKLAMLPDASLKQFAEMHKEDPYVFSLALSESNRRKEMRAQGQQAMPQPKVVDKELEEMNMRKELPENLGIARLPVDMNMASGGIVAFDDGGYVPRYKEKGAVKAPSTADLRQAIIDEANAQGVDPAIALQIAGAESSIKPSAVPVDPNTGKLRSSAKGLFGVIDDTFKRMGGDPEKRLDPMENIRVGVKSLAYTQDSLSKQLGRQPDASEIYAGHFLGAETGGKLLQADPNMSVQQFLTNTDPKNANNIIKSNPEVLSGKKVGDVLDWTQKKMAPVLTAMVPANEAVAQTTQAPAKESSWRDFLPSFGGDKVSSQSLSDLVTNKPQPASVVTPTAAPEKSWWDSANEKAEYLMNPPKKSGVAYDPKTFRNPEAQAIQPLYPELAILGAPGRMAAIAKRVLDTKPAASGETTAGLPSLVPKPAPQEVPTTASQESPLAIRRDLKPAEREQMNMPPRGPSYPVGEEASTMNFLARQRLARQGATKGVAQAEETPAAAAPTAVRNSPSVAQNIQTKMLSPSAGSTTSVAPEETFKPDYQPDTSRGYPSPAIDDRTKRDPANYKPEEKKQIIEAAKDIAPPNKDTDGWSKNDWLQFGLGIMAGKSQYALSNVGEAGLSLLASKQARESEKNKLDLYKAVHAEKPGQSIQIAERLMAADKNLSFEDALAKATALTGGATKEDLASTRADLAKTARIKAYQDGMKAIEGSMVGIIGKSPSATPAQKQAYENAKASLGKNPALEDGPQVVATAASASGWGVPQKQ